MGGWRGMNRRGGWRGAGDSSFDKLSPSFDKLRMNMGGGWRGPGDPSFDKLRMNRGGAGLGIG